MTQREKVITILRKQRRLYELSQEEVAFAAGISRPSLVNIEKGRQGLPVATWQALCVSLRLPDPVATWLKACKMK